MKTTIRRVSVLAALVAAASTGFLPRAARADDAPSHIWGMSNLGETCGGTCGPKNLCCKIVVVGPAPLAEYVPG